MPMQFYRVEISRPSPTGPEVLVRVVGWAGSPDELQQAVDAQIAGGQFTLLTAEPIPTVSLEVK